MKDWLNPATAGGQSVLALVLAGLVGFLWWQIPLTGPMQKLGLIVGPVLVLVPIGMAIVLKSPRLPVTLFIIFSFFRLHEVFPQLYPLKIPQLLALASLGALAAGVAFRQIRLYWRPELTPFAVFFVWVLLSGIAGTNKAESMAAFTGNFAKIGIMTLAIAWLARKPSDFQFILRAILLSGFVVALVALQNKVNGIGLVEGSRVTIGRDIGSVLGDPNDLALVLLFPAGFALAAGAQKGLGRFNRILGILVFVLVCLAIVATQSRGGLLGLAAVCGVIGLRVVKSRLVVGGLAIVALLALFSLANISDRKSGGAHEEGIDASAMGRLYAWEAAVGMATAKPLFGVGLNNFYNNYYLHTPHWDGKNHAVHSTWFGVLGETGFAGLGIFIWMVARTVITARRLRGTLSDAANSPAILQSTSMALVAGLAGFCVGGSFLTQGFVWPIYIQMALVTALARYCYSAPDKASR